MENFLYFLAGSFVTLIVAKWQIRKNKIFHYLINSYDVGKGLSADFPNVSLHYKNEVMSNNVYVLKGGFVNDGRNDIGEKGKSIQFQMVLPEGSIAKDIIISPIKSGLSVKPYINKKKKNVITFHIRGYFKSNESFEYSTIIEMSEEITFFPKIRFKHRIKDIKKIDSVYVGHYQSTINKYNKWTYYSIIPIISLFIINIIFTERDDVDYSFIKNHLYIFIPIIIALLCLLYMAINYLFSKSTHVINVLNRNSKKNKYK